MNIILMTLRIRGDISTHLFAWKSIKKRGHEAAITISKIHQHITTSADLDFIPCNTASIS
jgi:hypothetical protein